MYIITLILGIVGVVLLAFAIREDDRGKAKLRMEKLRKETVEDKAEELKATNLRIEQLREELKTLTDKSIDLNSEIQKNTAETAAFEATIDKVRLAQIL